MNIPVSAIATTYSSWRSVGIVHSSPDRLQHLIGHGDLASQGMGYSGQAIVRFGHRSSR
jgi:hypothetical protein